MSEFHIDYALVKNVLKNVKSIDSDLVDNDELVRALTYLVDRVRREERDKHVYDPDYDLNS